MHTHTPHASLRDSLQFLIFTLFLLLSAALALRHWACWPACRPFLPTSLSPLAISFSYFFFSLAAFVHRVAYLWLVLQTTVHPIFAISPVDKPGCLLLTSGQCVEPKTVKAVGGLLGALASFFFLVTSGRDVIFHLPVRASVATLCQIFELSLVLCRHGRPSLPTFLGDSEKLMEEPGCVSLCSSQQVHTRKAPGGILPFGLSGSPLPVVTDSATWW